MEASTSSLVSRHVFQDGGGTAATFGGKRDRSARMYEIKIRGYLGR